MLFVTNCVSPYDPGIEGKSGLLVVDGSIIKGQEKQVIMISKTASISSPEFVPIKNCNVKIIDNAGNEFVFNEESPGKYVSKINDAALIYDTEYKLIFTTSSGDEYESDYQWLLETHPVDSVYAIQEYQYSSETGTESISGIQFYVDLDVPENASRYYRWVPEETWEKHSPNEIWGEYDGNTIKKFNRPDSLFRCWETNNASGLYSASTINLSGNRIRKIPLHFIESSSRKLNYKYCVTIKQYALNADAYNYWYEKERELNESGTIYTNQPSQPKSNIHNIHNPDEKVVGFFWASSCAVKRVFVNQPSIDAGEENCGYVVVFCESNDFDEIVTQIYPALSTFAYLLPEPPVYITVERNVQYNIVLKRLCADCRVLGGEIQKPDFWEDDK